MYDLHAHILPGVDDGARTMEEAVVMARIAAKSGTLAVLATPHRRDVTEGSSIEQVQELVAEFRRELDNDTPHVELLLGMENHLDLELPEDLEKGRALPINGTRYALVEMPFFGNPNYMEDVLFQVQLQGITPVLAHPERSRPVKWCKSASSC